MAKASGIGLEDSVASSGVALVEEVANSSPEVEAKLQVAWTAGREVAQRRE